MKKQAAAINEYLSQYFTGTALAEGVCSACLAMMNGDSGYRALKTGISAARNVERPAFSGGQLC